MNTGNIRIDGERVYLRPLTVEDATPEYLSWLNDSETNKHLRTKQETMSGLQVYLRERLGRPEIFFAGIFDKSNDRHIGNVQLEIDESAKSGGMGILIGPADYRGKGLGTEVTKLIVGYALGDRGLTEVWLKVKSQNIAGRRAYEKAGFQVTKTDSETDYVTMKIRKDEIH